MPLLSLGLYRFLLDTRYVIRLEGNGGSASGSKPHYQCLVSLKYLHEALSPSLPPFPVRVQAGAVSAVSSHILCLSSQIITAFPFTGPRIHTVARHNTGQTQLHFAFIVGCLCLQDFHARIIFQGVVISPS